MVTVEVTYDMSKAVGAPRFEVEASTVGEAVAAVRSHFEDGSAFDRLAERTAVAVNGVLARYRQRLATPLSDGDRVSFVKAASGG